MRTWRLCNGVSTRELKQAVQRNRDRFPQDVLLRLSDEETAGLRSQIVISNTRGGRRHRPYAFTEQGVAMLSGVLRSPRAVAVNIEIMRAFVQLRRLLDSDAGLARKLEELWSAPLLQSPRQSPAALKPAASASRRVANFRVQFLHVAFRHVGE